jgi:hypothetical protein
MPGDGHVRLGSLRRWPEREEVAPRSLLPSSQGAAPSRVVTSDNLLPIP